MPPVPAEPLVKCRRCGYGLLDVPPRCPECGVKLDSTMLPPPLAVGSVGPLS